ncbi:WGR domain-containing protein (plasmid) [Bradyrhizobium barranii subsp. barranii]|uniref:WGR domain-containing protein n=1 Tax=Bradyrhizobium barranii subsp. barranii TaxID=2823807 RepID=A0A9X9YEJ5_9BRAD|nr:WGR domain-containing protein [Bradyrhizobium barranii]UEM18339.1 WGR domain-containing protein [Bradyrhizobium barranii subsp. barranii]
MPNLKLGPLHLRRIDTTRNMRRFYLLSIQPTLFGGVSLIRNWGRIGTTADFTDREHRFRAIVSTEFRRS